MARARNHPSVDWEQYFDSIRAECPWSIAAWRNGLVHIRRWGAPEPLGAYSVRVYTNNMNRRTLKRVCAELNQDTESEWLWSHPAYGAYGTPVPCFIQQNRRVLAEIRTRIQCPHK